MFYNLEKLVNNDKIKEIIWNGRELWITANGKKQKITGRPSPEFLNQFENKFYETEIDGHHIQVVPTRNGKSITIKKSNRINITNRCSTEILTSNSILATGPYRKEILKHIISTLSKNTKIAIIETETNYKLADNNHDCIEIFTDDLERAIGATVLQGRRLIMPEIAVEGIIGSSMYVPDEYNGLVLGYDTDLRVLKTPFKISKKHTNDNAKHAVERTAEKNNDSHQTRIERHQPDLTVKDIVKPVQLDAPTYTEIEPVKRVEYEVKSEPLMQPISAPVTTVEHNFSAPMNSDINISDSIVESLTRANRNTKKQLNEINDTCYQEPIKEVKDVSISRETKNELDSLIDSILVDNSKPISREPQTRKVERSASSLEDLIATPTQKRSTLTFDDSNNPFSLEDLVNEPVGTSVPESAPISMDKLMEIPKNTYNKSMKSNFSLDELVEPAVPGAMDITLSDLEDILNDENTKAEKLHNKNLKGNTSRDTISKKNEIAAIKKKIAQIERRNTIPMEEIRVEDQYI